MLLGRKSRTVWQCKAADKRIMGIGQMFLPRAWRIQGGLGRKSSIPKFTSVKQAAQLHYQSWEVILEQCDELLDTINRVVFHSEWDEGGHRNGKHLGELKFSFSSLGFSSKQHSFFGWEEQLGLPSWEKKIRNFLTVLTVFWTVAMEHPIFWDIFGDSVLHTHTLK